MILDYCGKCDPMERDFFLIILKDILCTHNIFGSVQNINNWLSQPILINK